MTDPRIVTPQEAQRLAEAMEPLPPVLGDLAYTVATEPDRTRPAVVKALRDAANEAPLYARGFLQMRADAIEDGATS